MDEEEPLFKRRREDIISGYYMKKVCEIICHSNMLKIGRIVACYTMNL